MLGIGLHGGLLAVALGIFPGVAARAVDTLNCPGIAGGNAYSEAVRRRSQELPRICSEDGDYRRRVLDPLRERLESCRQLAQVSDASWSPTPEVNLRERYKTACLKFRYYLENSTRICAVFAAEATRASSPAGSVNAVTAQEAMNASYRKLACIHGLLENAAWLSRSVGHHTGQLPEGSNPPPTDAPFVEAANAIRAQLAALRAKLSETMARLPVGAEAQARSRRIAADWGRCEAAMPLLQAALAYQGRLHSDLLRMLPEADRARAFFGARKQELAGMAATTGERAANLGEERAPKPAAPIVVRPRADGTPDVSLCPPDAQLTPLEKNLRDSVLSTYRPDTGEIGTMFRARTTDRNGQPVFHDVTAGHVAMTDYHNPGSNELATIRTNPAGNVPADSPARKLDAADIDRDRDIALRAAGFGPALPVKNSPGDAKEGDEFVIAGHPVQRYDANYTNMTCSFAGYGAGDQAGYYVLNCPLDGRSGGGFSGGPMVNPRTGEVWGVTTNQGGHYDKDGNYLYRDHRVFVSPVQQGSNGEILRGPQGYIYSNNCYYVEGSIPHPCWVTPGGTYPAR